jgi:hypothetical protein
MPLPDQKLPSTISPDQPTPLPSGSVPSNVSTCGDSLAFDVLVRYPYGATDLHEVNLPKFDVPLGAAPYNKDLFEDMARSIEKALEIAQNGQEPWIDLRVVDPNNYNAVELLATRARDQLQAAQQIWDYFADEWQALGVSVSGGFASPLNVYWPLDQNYDTFGGGSCASRSPGDTFDVGGKQAVCPDEDTVKWHTEWRDLYKKLIFASMKNARCAQEASAVTSVFRANERDAGPTIGIGPVGPTITPPPPVPPPCDPDPAGPRIAPEDCTPPAPPPKPPGETPPTTTTTTAPPKKTRSLGKVALGLGAAFLIYKVVAKVGSGSSTPRF